jgi:hypothetical protein
LDTTLKEGLSPSPTFNDGEETTMTTTFNDGEKKTMKRKIIADHNNSRKKIRNETGKKTNTVQSEIKTLANEATETTIPKSLEPKESLNCPIPRRKKSTLDSSDKKDSPRKKKSTLDSSDKKDSLNTNKKSTHASNVNDFNKETEEMNEQAAISSNRKFDYAKDGCLPPQNYISIPKKAAAYFTESMPHETDTLVFYVTDNEGEGNCFYQAICDSVAFVKEYPQVQK